MTASGLAKTTQIQKTSSHLWIPNGLGVWDSVLWCSQVLQERYCKWVATSHQLAGSSVASPDWVCLGQAPNKTEAPCWPSATDEIWPSSPGEIRWHCPDSVNLNKLQCVSIHSAVMALYQLSADPGCARGSAKGKRIFWHSIGSNFFYSISADPNSQARASSKTTPKNCLTCRLKS